jgi:hypothetical protein
MGINWPGVLNRLEVGHLPFSCLLFVVCSHICRSIEVELVSFMALRENIFEPSSLGAIAQRMAMRKDLWPKTRCLTISRIFHVDFCCFCFLVGLHRSICTRSRQDLDRDKIFSANDSNRLYWDQTFIKDYSQSASIVGWKQNGGSKWLSCSFDSCPSWWLTSFPC